MNPVTGLTFLLIVECHVKPFVAKKHFLLEHQNEDKYELLLFETEFYLHDLFS